MALGAEALTESGGRRRVGATLRLAAFGRKARTDQVVQTCGLDQLYPRGEERGCALARRHTSVLSTVSAVAVFRGGRSPAPDGLAINGVG